MGLLKKFMKVISKPAKVMQVGPLRSKRQASFNATQQNFEPMIAYQNPTPTRSGQGVKVTAAGGAGTSQVVTRNRFGMTVKKG